MSCPSDAELQARLRSPDLMEALAAIAACRETGARGQALLLGCASDGRQPAGVRCAAAAGLTSKARREDCVRAIRAMLAALEPEVRERGLVACERFALIELRDEVEGLRDDPATYWEVDEERSVGARARRVAAILDEAGAGDTARHGLDWPDPDDERAWLEDLLADLPACVNRAHNNLRFAVMDAKRLLGFRLATNRPRAEVVAALRAIAELGLAACVRMAPSHEAVTVSLGGTAIEVTSGVTASLALWLDAACAAVIVRDHAAIAQLTRMDLDAFGPTSDLDADVYTRWLHGFLCGARPHAIPHGVGRTPSSDLVAAVLRGDETGYGELLAIALRWQRGHRGHALHAHEPDELISLAHLALCVIAHDRGLPCPVRSGYVPSWLVDGTALCGAAPRDAIVTGTPAERYLAIEQLRAANAWEQLAALACDEALADGLRLEIIHAVSRPAPRPLLVETARRLCASPSGVVRLQGLTMCAQLGLRELASRVDELRSDPGTAWSPIDGGSVLVEIADVAAAVAARLRNDRAWFGIPAELPAASAPITDGYRDRRRLLLATPATTVGVDPRSAGALIGIAVEIHIEKRIVAVAVLADGSIHVGWSDLAWIVVEQPAVCATAERLWQWANYHRLEAPPVTTASPPPIAMASFHFVCTDGVRTHEAEIWTLAEDWDRMSRLYHHAHAIYAALVSPT